MKVNSKFNIFMQSHLSQQDFKVLVLLYQPLLGMEAYALYNTLYELSRLEEVLNHHFLFDLLNIQQNDFIKNREKLEALGLLESYEKNPLEYVYILKPPFSAKQFLVDTFLGTYLESEIGEKNLQFLLQNFKIDKPVLNHLTNLTKNFDDLYKFEATNLLNVDYEFEGKINNSNTLIRKSINYEDFVEKLPRALKGSELLNDNFKQKIIQLAFVYQFDINQMVEIYTNAHKGKKSVTIEQINLQAKMYYESLNKDLVVTNKEVDENEILSSIPFVAVIDKFGIDDQIQKAMALNTINDFISQNDIELGVLNVLIIFILKNKNGVLPHVNYLNKVWQSWSGNGVQSVSDAVNYRDSIEKAWSNKNQGKTNYSKKVNQPGWLDEYFDDFEKMEG